MEDDHDDEEAGQSLSDRLLDLFVYLPTGLAVTVAEELPRLAERGRERLGVQVDSARAVGHFAVTAGTHELKRRSAGLARTSSTPSSSASPGASTRGAPPAPNSPRLRTIPYPPDHQASEPPPGPAPAAPEGAGPAAPAPGHPPVDAHHPRVRHPLGLPGRPAPRRSQPGRAGGRAGLRDVYTGTAHHPQPRRPAPGRAVLSRS
jgi:hypothetical protein